MDRMAILAKTQKRHDGKSERGGGCNNPPPLLRERVNDSLLNFYSNIKLKYRINCTFTMDIHLVRMSR